MKKILFLCAGNSCRCLTADVAGKTVEILNRNLNPGKPADEAVTPNTKPLTKPPQVICKMQCTACHNQ